jgi:hypothetical protein
LNKRGAPLVAFKNDRNQLCLATLLKKPTYNNDPIYKKDDRIKDKIYKQRINKNSWSLTINMLTQAEHTEARHCIFVENQNESHRNIIIPLSEILLPLDFKQHDYKEYYACYDFIKFTYNDSYVINGRNEIFLNNWNVNKNSIDSLKNLVV